MDFKLLEIIENFRSNRYIDIKYSEKETFTINSVILMDSYDFNSDNFFNSFDDEQYDIFLHIKYDNNGPGPNKKYRYDPNSNKPFKYESDTSNIEKTEDILLFECQYYPFDLAAEKIFVTPFEESRKLIDEMTKCFFGKSVENTSSNLVGYKYLYDNDKMMINFYQRFINISGALDIVEWRHNSIYDWSTRMFWKALRTILKEDVIKIFHKATGLIQVPEPDIFRLPKTRLVAHEKCEIEYIPERYEIRVPSYASLEDMIIALKNSIKK